MPGITLIFPDVRAVPKPRDGHRQVWNKRHKNFVGFLEEMEWMARQMWRRDMIEGRLRVDTKITFGRNDHGDADNLHAAVLDALQDVCYENDKLVTQGSYELIIKKGKYRIECKLTPLNGRS